MASAGPGSGAVGGVARRASSAAARPGQRAATGEVGLFLGSSPGGMSHPAITIRWRRELGSAQPRPLGELRPSWSSRVNRTRTHA